MAEIISYPVNTDVLTTDLLLGTHIPPVGEGKPASTKNFPISRIIGLIPFDNNISALEIYTDNATAYAALGENAAYRKADGTLMVTFIP